MYKVNLCLFALLFSVRMNGMLNKETESKLKDELVQQQKDQTETAEPKEQSSASKIPPLKCYAKESVPDIDAKILAAFKSKKHEGLTKKSSSDLN